MQEKIPTITDIVQAYNLLVKNIDSDAQHDEGGRAYGGTVRSAKGKLVESIAKSLIQIAWHKLGGKVGRLSFEKKPIIVRLKEDYISKVQNPDVKAYIRNNLAKYIYKFRTDVHAYIDDKLVLGVECKAYAENAMMKRIMVDFTFLKEAHPKAEPVLLQLESQLGGDHSEIFREAVHFGSFPTHTILSHFDVNLNIITLLEGERKVDKPIHKGAFYKELKEKSVGNAVEVFKQLLSKSL